MAEIASSVKKIQDLRKCMVLIESLMRKRTKELIMSSSSNWKKRAEGLQRCTFCDFF